MSSFMNRNDYSWDLRSGTLVLDVEELPLSPELVMWRVCLEQAIRGFLEQRSDPGRWDIWWLFWEVEIRVGSMAWICEHLDIDFKRIRKQLFKWRHTR